MKNQKTIVCIELQYPYGKKRTFLSGSLTAAGARFHYMGYEVVLIDFNVHDETSQYVLESISRASYIALSVTGGPNIPSVKTFAEKMATLGTPILCGGQGIETISQELFDRTFCGTNAVRIENDMDLFSVLGIKGPFPSVFEIEYAPVLKSLDARSMKTFLENEMTLVISQGCLYRCAFCAAKKNRKEIFRTLKPFESDLRYIAEQAKQHNVPRIKFYASSLDFFQSARAGITEIMIEEILKIMARIRKETGIDIQTRCLCTMEFLLKASQCIPNLKELLHEAGLYRVGVGLDGTAPTVWKAQKKNHNKQHQIIDCMRITSEYGIGCEILMVVGFAEDNVKSLASNILRAFSYSRHKNVILRAYMAKEVAPGTDKWNKVTEQPFIEDPSRFHQIDYCAFASKITHPRFWHRLISNICYATLMLLFLPSGRSVTYPVFPIRGNAFKRRTARFLNDLMPGVD